jgi:hypothetical protein
MAEPGGGSGRRGPQAGAFAARLRSCPLALRVVSQRLRRASGTLAAPLGILAAGGLFWATYRGARRVASRRLGGGRGHRGAGGRR